MVSDDDSRNDEIPNSWSREDFSEEVIKALKEHPDFKPLKKDEKREGSRIDAREVALKFCFDFPEVSAAECEALAEALVKAEWRLAKRFSYRAARGISEFASQRRDAGDSSQAASLLAATLGVRVTRALVEMQRSHVIRFASKVFRDDAEELIAAAEERRRRAVAEEKRPAAIDYSKWDHLDSDDDDDAEHEAARLAVAAQFVDVEDRGATKPCGSVKDASEFVAACAECAEYSTLSGLDAASSEAAESAWRVFLADALWLALAFRGDKEASGWILSKRDDVDAVADFCTRGYERYVFLIRDACLHQTCLRNDACKRLFELCVSGGGPARSARDGGVALVALGSVAAAPGARENSTAVRDAALGVMPAVAELVRGLVGGRGDGDSALVGAALSLAEAASGVRTSARDGDFATTFEASGAAATLVDSGALSAFCSLAGRLAAESGGDARAREAERRLHRLLVAAAAQGRDSLVGAFALRAPAITDLVFDPRFFDRCPVEAALWATRLAVVLASTAGTLEIPPSLETAMRAALRRALAPAKDEQRRACMTHVMQQLNATRDATALWLARDDFANEALWSLRDGLGRATKPDQPASDASATSDDEENKDRPTAAAVASRERRLARFHREAKRLPLAPRCSKTAPASGVTLGAFPLGGKVD
ncbi:hypothetical protein CTAYLR_007673 [Chrysophaeum taylorii]|uniref:Uncharacterized protein n=1 Tax=Chrysophaeum taylorii TaxID=2483200 RepID=A0AAD7XH12_9STRA|nr:hypothetical protein CTAYLR_007673 [Chrysophaeum taylorii]